MCYFQNFYLTNNFTLHSYSNKTFILFLPEFPQAAAFVLKITTAAVCNCKNTSDTKQQKGIGPWATVGPNNEQWKQGKLNVLWTWWLLVGVLITDGTQMSNTEQQEEMRVNITDTHRGINNRFSHQKTHIVFRWCVQTYPFLKVYRIVQTRPWSFCCCILFIAALLIMINH